MRALKVGGAVVGLLVAIVVSAAFFALRDSPAREASGQPKRTMSGRAEIAYFTGGPEGAARMMLLPSYARSVSDFNELASILHSAGYQTLAIQPRGVDGSSLPSFDTSLHTLAGDVAAVLDSEKVSDPVYIIGHAYGNRVARTVASDYPDRVAGLVLLAAGGARPTPPETGQAISRVLFGIGSSLSREEAVKFAFFAKDSTVLDYWLRSWYPRAGLAQARAISNTPLDEWSSGGMAPILVLEPSEDAAAAGAGAVLSQQYPDRVRVVEVNGAGHALLPERLEFVAQEVVAYLGGAQGGSGTSARRQ
jgi:pimeloyl-ACP methyl ester carboxylesterase